MCPFIRAAEKGLGMKKSYAGTIYPSNADITFTTLPRSVAIKLWEFAHSIYTGRISGEAPHRIVVNGVVYTLHHISCNKCWECTSVYYKYRNRLCRVSDHWTSGRHGGTTHCPTIGKHFWSLRGTDESFLSGVEWSEGRTITTPHDRPVEGGWCPLHKIRFRTVVRLHTDD